VGVVVGVIDDTGPRIVAHGARSAADPTPLDGATAFEIGSISKVFTALLLTDMAERGEVGLDDEVATLLPSGVRMAEHGRPIRLRDLATHRSGLPRWPGDMAPALGAAADWSNPYAGYRVAQLHAFLSLCRPAREPGAAHVYSNLGVGLLGHLLARRAGRDYESLLRERITGVLGLARTGVAVPAQAMPHDPRLRPVAPWEMPTFAGAGALRSTADDMLAFLAAQAGLTETPLRAAMAAQRTPRTPSDAGYLQALGWRIDVELEDGEIVWHGGATGGSRAFALFEPERRAGVVMLTNCAITGNDDLPFHILSGRPLKPPAPMRATITLPSEVLDRHLGLYRLAPGLDLLVSREGARVFAQMTGQWRLEILAQSETRFFWVDAAAEVDFAPAEDGRSGGLVLRQNGREYPAARVARDDGSSQD
jgi:serine-type D-Ala-D-Ala carboxypeptidase/endopeptidase